MFLSSRSWGSSGRGQRRCVVLGAVRLFVPQHGQDDVAAPPSEADDGGVMALALGALAVVERFGVGAAQRGKCGEEHGVFEPMVASSGLGLRIEGLAGL